MKYEPIAVVGMACRFPGADDLDAFWSNLLSSVDAITPVPETRWDVDKHYDEFMGTPGKMYTKQGGFIKGIDLFDADFFNISDRQANHLDPQHHLLLTTTWRAFENAGINLREQSDKSCGVFVGIGSQDYTYLQLLDSSPGDLSQVNVKKGSWMDCFLIKQPVN